MRTKEEVNKDFASAILVVQSYKLDFSPEGNRAFLNAMRECNRLRDELYAIDRRENDQQVEMITKVFEALESKPVLPAGYQVKRPIRPGQKSRSGSEIK